MANIDKNIVITPNNGSASDPNIVFSGANATTGAQNITLTVTPNNSGTVAFSGSAGQLLTINNDISNTLSTGGTISATGNITANNFVGSLVGNVTGNFSGSLANGTSNVSIPAANGNVNISAVGNANILIVTGTGANIAGTLSVSGNANSANLNTGNISSTGNITTGAGTGGTISGANLVSANFFTGTLTTAAQPNITSVGTLTTLSVSGNANVGNIGATNGVFTNVSGNGSSLSSLTGANVTGQVGNALVAGTVYTNAQPNITSVGTLTTLSVSGNITANNFVGNLVGNVTGNFSGSLANGNSNVNIPAANGNVNISAVGNANIVVVTGTGANIAGTLSATGNANVGNIGANNGVFTNVSGNGSALTGIVAGNITGQVANALVAGTVYTNAQPNITSVGTLSSLSVSGTATLAEVNGTNASFSGNATVNGNLFVNGNLTYLNVETVAVEDPIIQLQTGANGAAPIANSGKDVGTALNYYDTAAKIAFMGWDVSNAEIAFGSNVSITNEVVTFTSLANTRSGNTLTTGVFATTLSATGNITGGNLITSGLISVTGGITASSYTASNSLNGYFLANAGNTVGKFYENSSSIKIEAVPTGYGVALASNGATRLNIDANGYSVIGTNAGTVTGYSLAISRPTSGAAVAGSLRLNAEIQPDVTTTAIYSYTTTSTAANSAPYTITNVIASGVYGGTYGANSTVTNQFAYYVDSSFATGNTTNIYGLYTGYNEASGCWGIYLSGSAQNYINGTLGIGSTSVGLTSGINFRSSRVLSGNTASYGVLSDGQIQSDVTSAAILYRSTAQTQAATFTLADIVHFQAVQGTFGASSAVTTQTAFSVGTSLTGATNNYGFRSTLQSGTGRYNLYLEGTATNFINGFTGFGTTNPLVAVQIGGDSDYNELRMMRSINNGQASAMVFAKARGTESAQTIVQNGDTLGTLLWNGNDGSGSTVGSVKIAAQIDVKVEGTPGTGNIPGRMMFYTTSLTGTFTERMRINNSGNVGIGNTAPTTTLAVTGTLYVSGNANVGNLGTTGVFATTLSATGNANVGNIGANNGVFTSVSGNGSALTSLNASNLSSGTVSSSVLNITTSTTDTTAGKIMRTADWGFGTTAFPITDFTSNNLNYSQIFRALSNATGGTGTAISGVALPYDGTPTTSYMAVTPGTTVETVRAWAGTKTNSNGTPVWAELARLTAPTFTNYIGIGGINQNYIITVNGSQTGNTTTGGINIAATVQNDVTSTAYGVLANPTTAADVFTLANFRGFQAGISLGAGSTVTNAFGFTASSLLGTNATNGYGFYSDLAAAANKWNFYATGSANNYMAGSLGIGSTSLGAINMRVSKSLTGGTTAFNFVSDGTISSDVTTNAVLNRVVGQTQAAAFTLTNLIYSQAVQGTFGAGSAVTTQSGFVVDNTLTGATNNYGFRGSIASGANRFNLYMDGTANNYMAGSLGIGTTSPAVALHVKQNGGAINVEGTDQAYIQFYPRGIATRTAFIGVGSAGSNNFTIRNDDNGQLQLQSGNSNVSVFANGNVTTSVAGVANVLVVTSTGANIAGTLSATGNITGNFFIGNGSQLTGITTATSLANGNSNIAIPAANGNVNISAVGNANIVVVTGTGANITGTLSATGNVTGGNLIGIFANGNSSISIPAANGNINISAAGSPNEIVITGTGINVAGTLNATGNANVGNLGTTGVFATTLSATGNANVGNLGAAQGIFTTSANIPLIRSGTSNITLTSGANVSTFIGGNATAQLVVTSTGANIPGTANIVGLVTGGNFTTTGANATVTANNLTLTGAASGNVNVAAALSNLGLRTVAATYTDTAVTGTQANGAIHYIAVPTITGGTNAKTYTNMATFHIAGPVTASTNATITTNYALFVASGNTFLGGTLSATGNVTGGNLLGIFANGNSSISIPAANGNINISAAGSPNEIVITGTGINVAGTLNVTGNANVGNLGTTTAVITTGNITTINSGLLQNGNSNVSITANANVAIAVTGANRLVVTSTGANLTGTLNISGNTTFSGIGQRILGDFSNVTLASRTAFQDKTTNAETSVYALPNGTSNAAGFYSFNNSTPTNAAYGGFAMIGSLFQIASGNTGSGTTLPMTFNVGGTEAARFNTSQNFLIGSTSATVAYDAASWKWVGYQVISRNTTAETNQIVFYNPNGSVGFINSNGTSTTYNTTSDYRLKENAQPMTGALAKILSLNPVTYTWKIDGSSGQGFIAHELQSVIPDAVSGTKDAVDEEGNPRYQGVDTSLVVATLVASVKELTALVTQLQAEVNNLKNP